MDRTVREEMARATLNITNFSPDTNISALDYLDVFRKMQIGWCLVMCFLGFELFMVARFDAIGLNVILWGLSGICYLLALVYLLQWHKAFKVTQDVMKCYQLQNLLTPRSERSMDEDA